MKIYKYDILFQEVPDEISLGFYVCGCALRCPGCHSPELWSEKNGFELTHELFHFLLQKYSEKISCVLFLGGEWRPNELIGFLRICEEKGLKTALYSGLNEVPQAIKAHLDFLKCGPWREELGGLNSTTTNQIFWDVKNNKKLNHKFQQPETQKEIL